MLLLLLLFLFNFNLFGSIEQRDGVDFYWNVHVFAAINFAVLLFFSIPLSLSLLILFDIWRATGKFWTWLIAILSLLLRFSSFCEPREYGQTNKNEFDLNLNERERESLSAREVRENSNNRIHKQIYSTWK